MSVGISIKSPSAGEPFIIEFAKNELTLEKLQNTIYERTKVPVHEQIIYIRGTVRLDTYDPSTRLENLFVQGTCLWVMQESKNKGKNAIGYPEQERIKIDFSDPPLDQDNFYVYCTKCQDYFQGKLKLYCKQCYFSADSSEFVVARATPTTWLDCANCEGNCYQCGDISKGKPKITSCGWYTVCKGKEQSCKSSSLEGKNRRVVGLIANEHRLECPLSLAVPEQLFVFSCKHAFDPNEIKRRFNSEALISSHLVLNTNENKTIFGNYMLGCPICEKGGLCLESLRIFPELYKKLIVNRIEHYIQSYSEVVFCGLPTHPPPRYFPLESSSSASVEVHCPACDKNICKYCGVEWGTNCNHFKSDDEFTNHMNILDEILTNSAMVRCPKCKQPGVKDNNSQHNCTHIYCPCKAIYCFCCEKLIGRAEEAVPVASKQSKISAHNDTTGCPLYLNINNKFANEQEATNDHIETKMRDTLKEYQKDNNVAPVMWSRLITTLMTKYTAAHLEELL